jgi:hypothetical protein
VKRFTVLKFINVSATLEAELFKHLERSVNCQTVDIHSARLLDNVVRIVILVYSHGNSVWRICNLCNSIYNKTVVFFAVVRGYNIQTVADVEKGVKVVFVSCVALLSKILHTKFL